MTEKTVDVLGTTYKLIICEEAEDKRLDGYDGICDETIKECVVENFENFKGDPRRKANLDVQMKKNIRHELIHAFLFESGLAENSDWAQNEEMVDWIAKQFPKLQKAFEMADAI